MNWCRRHSVSLMFCIGWLVTTLLSKYVKYGTWWCDFWLGLSTGFAVGAIAIVIYTVGYEPDADPTKKPRQGQDQ